MQHAPGVIEAARVAAGISKRQLAQRASMIPSTLTRKLRGDSPFDVDELVALAKALDLPLSDIFGDAA